MKLKALPREAHAIAKDLSLANASKGVQPD